MHDAILTNKPQHHYNLATSPIYQRCGTHDEDVLHCLRDCAPSKEVWQQIYSVNHPYFSSFTSLKTWLHTKELSITCMQELFGGYEALEIIILLATNNEKPKMSFIV